MQAEQKRTSRKNANAIQIKIELQADCLAGVWAKRADEIKPLLEPGDIEEGLQAASAIGDDRLQKETQRTVVPESFTHGTSQQRVKWFPALLSRPLHSDCMDNLHDRKCHVYSCGYIAAGCGIVGMSSLTNVHTPVSCKRCTSSATTFTGGQDLHPLYLPK